MARRGEIGDEKDGRDSSVEKGLKRCGRPASFSSPLFLISTTTFILLLLTLLSITSPGDAAEAPPRRVKNKAGTNAVIAKTGGKTPLEVNKAKGSELQEPHVANLDFVIDDEDLFPAFVAFVKQKTGGQGVEPLYFLDQVKDYKQVDPDDAVSLNRFGKYLYEEFVTGDSMVTFDNYQITEDLKNAYDNGENESEAETWAGPVHHSHFKHLHSLPDRRIRHRLLGTRHRRSPINDAHPPRRLAKLPVLANRDPKMGRQARSQDQEAEVQVVQEEQDEAAGDSEGVAKVGGGVAGWRRWGPVDARDCEILCSGFWAI